MQAGQWFGEEAVIMDMPIVYTAVAFTPCKLLKIHVSDFKECVPEDVINRMVKKTRKKVKWMRDRMSELHDERIKL
jgi:CRP-like cAMP-binding protein